MPKNELAGSVWVTAAEQMRQAHAAASVAKRVAQETEAKLGLHCQATYLAWVAADHAAMAAYRSCAAVDLRRPLPLTCDSGKILSAPP